MSSTPRALLRGLSASGAVLVLLGWVHAQPAPRPLPVPDLPGYVTLKADLHLHSVFSDGEVWPTVHVREAWRDGLDVVSLTEHLEYRPHRRDVTGGPRRAFEVAQTLAARLGVLLVPGLEITRPIPGAASDWPVGSAHFNVLFPTDVDALDTPDLTDALSRARAQGAFVFWNHPGFMDKPATWFPHVATLYEAGLFSGIEVVNGDRFYPEALQWASQRRLTPLACSDAHLPMPAHLKSASRPVTLVFVPTRDLAGVKEALTARRTLAWLDRHVWGDRDLLSALWTASIDVEPVDGAAGLPVEIVIRNRSAIDFDVRAWATPSWLSLDERILEHEASTVVRGRLAPGAPSGDHALSLRLTVANLQPAPGAALEATLPLTLRITAGRLR